jgi:formylglycine-generating enzyme required for sulfatase activity
MGKNSVYIILLFLLFGCKVTKEQPGMPKDYHPVFDQTKKQYVKTPSVKGVKLDTIVKVWSNIQETKVEIADTILIYNDMDYVEGELLVDVELINEKPPTIDTFMVVKGFKFNPELINTLFPILADSLKAEISGNNDSIGIQSLTVENADTNFLSGNMSDSLFLAVTDTISDSLKFKISESEKFLSREQIKADTSRDLLDVDNILDDLIIETKWKLNDSILLTQDYTSFYNDSSVYIIGDTLITEVFDSSKVVPQLPFNKLCKEKTSKYVSYERLDHRDEVVFIMFYGKFEDVFLEMVRVQGGEFKMGNNEFDEDERPAMNIDVSGFMISKYEITNQLFVFFLNFMECDTLGQVEGYYAINLESPDTKIKWDKYSKKFFVLTGYEDYPVVNVTWQGAQIFCSILNGKLPSEAEWEFAARGGVYAIRYYTGINKDDFEYEYRFAGGNVMTERGWFVDNSYGRTHKVGMLKPNQLGIFDMCGNVWEWCYDKYNKDFYKTNNDSHDPECLSGPPVRTNRGGSWSSDAVYCRITNRNYLSQTECNPYLGFRLKRKL